MHLRPRLVNEHNDRACFCCGETHDLHVCVEPMREEFVACLFCARRCPRPQPWWLLPPRFASSRLGTWDVGLRTPTRRAP